MTPTCGVDCQDSAIEFSHNVHEGNLDMQTWRNIGIDHLTKLQQYAALGLLDEQPLGLGQRVDDGVGHGLP